MADRPPVVPAVTGRRIAIAAAVIVVVLLLRSIDSVDASWFPRCPLADWTGLLCPGCGSTRALHALANGNFAAALAFNPLLTVGGPLLMLWLIWRRWQGKPSASTTLPTIIVTVMVAYFIARNLPGPTQRWLAPREFTSSPEASPSPVDGGPVDVERNETQ